jgi:hypothetical protein
MKSFTIRAFGVRGLFPAGSQVRFFKKLQIAQSPANIEFAGFFVFGPLSKNTKKLVFLVRHSSGQTQC